jgi:hypothetical protein
MSLSDKIENITYDSYSYEHLQVKDVKEALRQLLKWINQFDLLENKHFIHKAHIRRRINKIFGKELSEEVKA